MNIRTKAGNSLIFYSGKNFAGSSLSVLHGETDVLASANNNWTWQSVAMNNMHAFCWSVVNVGDATLNYQNHTESLITASIPDLTALYTATAFPLSYLGIDPAVATPVWLDLSAVTGEVNALAATSVVGGSTTSITTLSRPGLEGVAGFVGLTAGSSVIASCSYGTYNSATGQVAWSGLNAGTLLLEYTGGAVTTLSASGFPEGWTFSAPAMQADGSWIITISGSDASGNTITSLTSDKTSISNNGTDSATLTATVLDGGGAPAKGVTVNWSATPGELSAATSVTDTAGQATVPLTDTGDTGACVVTASLDNGSMKSVSVALTDDSGDATIVSLISDKDTIGNDGEDQAYLTATVQDASGSPVEGVKVSWTTDLGTLNHKQQDTDATGQSHAKLSDLGDTGSAMVTASLDNDSFAEVTVRVAESGADERIISVVSDKQFIENNGSGVAILKATVWDSLDKPVAGKTVHWNTSVGDLSTKSSVTNMNGEAMTSLTDNGDTGSATVTAWLDNGSTGSVDINLIDTSSGLTITSLTSDKATLDINGASATLTAIVKNARNQYAEGVTVHWSVVNGKLNTSSSVTDASGAAQASVTATGGDEVIVTATLDNGDKESITLNAIQPETVFPAFTAINVKKGSGAGTISFELVAHSMPGGQYFVFRFNTTPLSGSAPGNPHTTLSLTDTTHVFLSDTAYSVTSTYIQQNIETYLNHAPADDITATIHIVIDNLNLTTSTWSGGTMTAQYSVGGGSFKSAPDIYIPALE